MFSERPNLIKGLAAGFLLVVAGVIVMFRGGNEDGFADQIQFVCVETGEIFELDREQIQTIPVANPVTDRLTLLPCKEKEGVLKVGTRYREALAEMVDFNNYVDPETLEVAPE